MARYIDTDKLCEALKSMASVQYPDKQSTILGVVSSIENFPTVDVVPKSEEGAECPTCHGTGRIGTTDWLTKNISKKQLAEKKEQAIAEHEQHIKTEYAKVIFEEIKKYLVEGTTYYGHCIYSLGVGTFANLEKKYTEEKE